MFVFDKLRKYIVIDYKYVCAEHYQTYGTVLNICPMINRLNNGVSWSLDYIYDDTSSYDNSKYNINTYHTISFTGYKREVLIINKNTKEEIYSVYLHLKYGNIDHDAIQIFDDDYADADTYVINIDKFLRINLTSGHHNIHTSPDKIEFINRYMNKDYDRFQRPNIYKDTTHFYLSFH